jgi:hypothetical protein
MKELATAEIEKKCTLEPFYSLSSFNALILYAPVCEAKRSVLGVGETCGQSRLSSSSDSRPCTSIIFKNPKIVNPREHNAIVHEFGHNLGLKHGSSDCENDGIMNSTCDHVYGDKTVVMGNSFKEPLSYGACSRFFLGYFNNHPHCVKEIRPLLGASSRKFQLLDFQAVKTLDELKQDDTLLYLFERPAELDLSVDATACYAINYSASLGRVLKYAVQRGAYKDQPVYYTFFIWKFAAASPSWSDRWWKLTGEMGGQFVLEWIGNPAPVADSQIGDGFCDRALNNAENEWDGMDCCSEWCESSDWWACGINGYACACDEEGNPNRGSTSRSINALPVTLLVTASVVLSHFLLV